jgi:hypothetical protein
MKYKIALYRSEEGYSVSCPGRVLRQGKHIIMTDGIRISDDPAQQPGKRNNNGRDRSRCRVDGRAIQGAPITPESSLASLCLSLNLGSTVPWDDVNR